ncbi:Inner membrane protein ynjI [Serratia fonticola]|uniref:DUF1266 domain-containing protein n=1 Tax=Serratia fonticola TaxID=47917 RepID=UPI002177AC7F|nr:DUF1266 domain-containing protein [Serratia fonticola]CAI1963604.1 Inner membrane protein ynjI [Serratia fonticola]
MKELMQNHPLFKEFPVKNFKVFREKYREAGNQGMLKALSPLTAVIAVLLVIPTLLGIGLSFLLIIAYQDSLISTSLPPLVYWIWGCTTLAIGLVAVGFSWLVKTPMREQRRYYQQGSLGPLEDNKRQALRLDIVQTYSQGFWSETLEHYPIAARLQDPIKTFPLLDPSQPKDHLKGLYDDWNIADARHYREAVNQLLAGMHSPHFAFNMRHSVEDDTWVRNLAALIEEPVDYIHSCMAPGPDQRPPALIWAFDLWRVITLSRSCFCAGLIEEQEAWDNILKTADMAHELFASFDEFNKNYRLGHAFWSNDFALVKGRLTQFKDYRQHCHWPIKSLPWPARPGIDLSDDILSGFAHLQPEQTFISSLKPEDYVA